MACGLLGHILSLSGYWITFVVRRPEVAEAINRHRGYRLTVTGPRGGRLAVRRCVARSIADGHVVADAVAQADIVMTGIGVDNLPAVTPLIARGLWQRSRAQGAAPLNVIACENLPGAGAYLRHQVVSAAPIDQAMAVDAIAGFSAAITRRIMTGGHLEDGELRFTVSGSPDLVIDAQGLKHPFPGLTGVTLTDEFGTHLLRKLYLLNGAQAVAAYLGHREGCRLLHDAVAHPRVAPVVRDALCEAREALTAEFPHHAADIACDAAQVIGEIANPALDDTVSRVAREPRRKLGPLERLVGPARLAHKHELPGDNLCLGIAAALAYDDPADADAAALQAAIAAEGVATVLTVECGLLPHEALARAVKQQWLNMTQGNVWLEVNR